MHQAPVGCACLAIAQTKPASSRAIAAVTTVGGFPARTNLRYLRHSRSCAFSESYGLPIWRRGGSLGRSYGGSWRAWGYRPMHCGA